MTKAKSKPVHVGDVVKVVVARLRPNEKNREVLSDWFDKGVARKHVHMLVVANADERWPLYLNLSDGKERFEAVTKQTEDDGGCVIEVYCLTQEKDQQIAAERSWSLAWDWERSRGFLADRVSSRITPATIAAAAEFKGLRYYGIRYNGALWVGHRDVTYCFGHSPIVSSFTDDPTRAKVWPHTRINEVKRLLTAGRGATDMTKYEIVNMHTGAAAPLERIRLEDSLTLE